MRKPHSQEAHPRSMQARSTAPTRLALALALAACIQVPSRIGAVKVSPLPTGAMLLVHDGEACPHGWNDASSAVGGRLIMSTTSGSEHNVVAGGSPFLDRQERAHKHGTTGSTLTWSNPSEVSGSYQAGVGGPTAFALDALALEYPSSAFDSAAVTATVQTVQYANSGLPFVQLRACEVSSSGSHVVPENAVIYMGPSSGATGCPSGWDAYVDGHQRFLVPSGYASTGSANSRTNTHHAHDVTATLAVNQQAHVAPYTTNQNTLFTVLDSVPPVYTAHFSSSSTPIRLEGALDALAPEDELPHISLLTCKLHSGTVKFDPQLHEPAPTFVDAEACPGGWTELKASLTGRFVVGLAAGGALGATFGNEMQITGRNDEEFTHTHVVHSSSVRMKTTKVLGLTHQTLPPALGMIRSSDASFSSIGTGSPVQGSVSLPYRLLLACVPAAEPLPCTPAPTTRAPTRGPTGAPSRAPTRGPTEGPTSAPVFTRAPTRGPTRAPSRAPTVPTSAPTGTANPTGTPTRSPTTSAPTAAPTVPLQVRPGCYPAGACCNSKDWDFGWLGGGGFAHVDSDMKSCYLACQTQYLFYGPAPYAECVAEYFQATLAGVRPLRGSNYTAPCALCLGEYSACEYTQCPDECGVRRRGTSSCRECLKRRCDVGFALCSGIVAPQRDPARDMQTVAEARAAETAAVTQASAIASSTGILAGVLCSVAFARVANWRRRSRQTREPQRQKPAQPSATVGLIVAADV